MTDKNPEYFMQEAAKTVSQRGTDNGYDAGQERSAAAVADMFNSMYPEFNLTEEHIWAILLSLKLVRNARKPREDNIVDMISYAGLLGESQSAPKRVKPSLHEKRGPSMAAKKVIPQETPIARKGLWLVPCEGVTLGAIELNTSPGEDSHRYWVNGLGYMKSHWTLKEYK